MRGVINGNILADVSINGYTGLETETAKVTINNAVEIKTIAVDVKQNVLEAKQNKIEYVEMSVVEGKMKQSDINILCNNMINSIVYNNHLYKFDKLQNNVIYYNNIDNDHMFRSIIINTENRNIDYYQFRISDGEDIEEQLRQEIARATTRENEIASDLANETSDRQTADEELQFNINTENERAIAAETDLGNALDEEITRAENAEDELDDKIDQEILDRMTDVDNEEIRAKAAEDELNTRIDNLDLATVGQNGYYIKTVGQENGQLSADKQAFDTLIDNSADNTNTPTTKAVKDYVDNEIDKLDSSVGNNTKVITGLTITNGKVSANTERTITSNIEGDVSNIPTDEAVKNYVYTSINDLDVTITGLAKSKTITSLSETDGKISASAEDIAITSSQITDKTNIYDQSGESVVTGKAIKDAIDDLNIQEISISSNKTVNKITEVNGIIGVTSQDIQISESQVTDLSTDLANITNKITNIENKIPEQATSSNQLADKDFVNSSIETNTATFKGSYNIVTDLGLTTEATEEQIVAALDSLQLEPDNNDYVFIGYPDDTVATEYVKFDRYKYTKPKNQIGFWQYEYTLNNSSFTAEQWAAINSGATSELVSQISSNTAARHTHGNKELLDTYTQTEANLADAVDRKHSHSNKALLDTYTQTETDLADAVANTHTHSNKATLDDITAAYTTDEKTKLSNIESGAQVNVQSDWDQSNTNADDYIKNKPSIPTNTSDLNNDSDFIDSSALNGYATESWVEEQGYSTFDGDYNSLENKPELADVATSGSYNDLLDTPDLSDYARNDELSNVAFSGDYDDLSNTPEITEVSGENDGDYWTSLTIGYDTYDIPSGSDVYGYHNDNYWTSLRIGDEEYSLAPVVSGTHNNKVWTSLTIDDTNYDLTLPGVKIPSNTNELNLFDKKTWINAPDNFYAIYLWTDDDNIYYSAGYNKQYKLNKSTDTWEVYGTGISNLDGCYVWRDNDNNIYYSKGTAEQYKWNKLTHTWTTQTWQGLTDFKGLNVWTDGTNIYYSDYSSSGGNKQYVLSGTTWSIQSWGSGFDHIKGQYVWTDGDNIYYSEGNSNQYVLDKENLTWSAKTWINLPGNFYGSYVWTDGYNYYTYSTDGGFVLDKTNSTWLTKNWYGVDQISAQKIWRDGDKLYYSTEYQLNTTYHIAETLTKVAETGDYNDLINKPVIPNIPEHITGNELEDLVYTTGKLYYCTENSESFTAGNMYFATGTDSIVKVNNTAVSTNPKINTFTISPTSTEWGDSQSISYSYSLKKYSQFTSLQITGGSSTETITPIESSGSGNITGTYYNTTFTLSGIANGTTYTKSASISGYKRMFFCGSNDTVANVLTSLKDVQASTTSIQTNTTDSANPTKVNINLGSTAQYVYFIVPSNLSISYISSGGFVVPYSLIDTTSFTNHYDATYSVKVYRTDSQIFGSIDYDLTW